MALKMTLSASQLRATISAHVGRRAIPIICVVVLVAYAASQTWLHELAIHEHHSSTNSYLLLIAVVQTAFAVFLMWFAARPLLGSEVVTLTSSVLEVDVLILGCIFRKDRFDTQTIVNLRYEEWSGYRYGKPSGIKFETSAGTFILARYAKVSEGYELLDGMLSILGISFRPDGANLTRTSSDNE